MMKFDQLAMIMTCLVVYIGICVAIFASNYMKGDKKYYFFFTHLILLIFSVVFMVSTDNLGLLLIANGLSNLLLVRLMIHKANWKAAKASGMIAAKYYTLSAILMGGAFTILYFHLSSLLFMALVLILISSMIQSAIWPFHKWLLSSLNSPTPVSAMMHAGLINGGGFLLVRFAPLYLSYPTLLTAIFCIGLVTALLGTLWKLMQHDVKRMLACSTMGQMGFMLVQCGLGLFPAAVAHLVWHGLFKSYLFLSSNGYAQEKRLDLAYPPSIPSFFTALIVGAIVSFAFAYASGESWLAGDTTLVLLVVAFLAASQLALPMLRVKILKNLPLAFSMTTVAGLAYGGSVHLITWVMKPMGIMQPQPLNLFHIAGMIALVVAWLAILFIRNENKKLENSSWMLQHYVKALNASQPYPETITAHHNHYQYL